MKRALTEAEARVVALAREGLSTPAIAETLGIGRKTVETHLAHAYRKLGVRSRNELRSLRPDDLLSLRSTGGLTEAPHGADLSDTEGEGSSGNRRGDGATAASAREGG